MRYTKINPKAVSSLREKIRITQQELAARVGCSLSAVQFWEAGRSSPRGYRLRKLVELCPDDESKSLFFALPAEEAADIPPVPKTDPPDDFGWEKRYLDPSFLRTLPVETRNLFSQTVENIRHLSALTADGNQVAVEGLYSLAEALKHAAGVSLSGKSGQITHPHAQSHSREPEERVE
jgi:transcriptional regulator with XRE-family HTH domain